MNDLFFLSEGGPYGDPIAEITEYKDGYLLKSYGPEDVCLAFDYISKEDGDELIKYKDNPSKAFDGCGSEEVFCHQDTRRLKEYFGYDDIIQAVVSVHGEEEADFMNKVAPKMNMYYFFNFMEEDLEKDFDNVEDLMNKIKEKPTFSEQCNAYDWYKHA